MADEQEDHPADAHTSRNDTNDATGGEHQSGFLRLPAEIRLQIYEYVLLPEPAIKVPCNGTWRRGHPSRILPADREVRVNERQITSATTGRDRDSNVEYDPAQTNGASQAVSILCDRSAQLVEGLLVGSSCELRPSSLKNIRDDWPRVTTDYTTHIEILAVNKQVFSEAVAVLYENCRVCVREPHKCEAGTKLSPYGCPRALARLSPTGAQHVRKFHLEIDACHRNFTSFAGKWQIRNLIFDYSWILPRKLPNLKLLSIHIDVDLTWGGPPDSADFEGLHVLADEAEFAFDVHITADWDGGGGGWQESTYTFGVGEDMVPYVNEKARTLRDELVLSLSELFKVHGKKLRIAEE